MMMIKKRLQKGAVLIYVTIALALVSFMVGALGSFVIKGYKTAMTSCEKQAQKIDLKNKAYLTYEAFLLDHDFTENSEPVTTETYNLTYKNAEFTSTVNKISGEPVHYECTLDESYYSLTMSINSELKIQYMVIE